MQRRQILEERERLGESPLLHGDEAVTLIRNGKREVGALSCELLHDSSRKMRSTHISVPLRRWLDLALEPRPHGRAHKSATA